MGFCSARREPGKVSSRDFAEPDASCPICGSSVKRWRTKLNEHGTFDIDRCQACAYAFVNPRPTRSYLMDFYATSGHGCEAAELESAAAVLEQERAYPNSTLDAARMIAAITRILGSDDGAGLDFLDVGCGYGFFSREAVRRGFRVTAIEMASRERAVAEQVSGLVPIAVAFEDYEQPPASFWAILMSQILEHVGDVELWIARARALLRPGGILAVALPNFGSAFRLLMQENEPYVCPPAHLNFFTAGNLSRLLRDQGFEIVATDWISRLPRSTFEKRLGRPAAGAVHQASRVVLKTLDTLRLGQMLNVYGRARE